MQESIDENGWINLTGRGTDQNGVRVEYEIRTKAMHEVFFMYVVYEDRVYEFFAVGKRLRLTSRSYSFQALDTGGIFVAARTRLLNWVECKRTPADGMILGSMYYV